ncbi:Wound-responsive family protein [Perilla frutescens var. hirtella]|uniref:Wound-responsive family protein n=1 Tax=Perilla frutescens var. hirtella TaxID=608512 RepID=A0AAD4J4M2_PERFH|nr:hypothetical protein C2S51_038019 [Perilla frutescens var. frutescens]KAH6827128.1 Wound-responsive family protein [Perilla frutescens var. hirtella]
MSYMNRVWMAASVAVVNGHADQGQKLKSGLKSINHGKKRFFTAGGDAADLRPLSGALNTDIEGCAASGGGNERRRQGDDSLRQVMYLNCWGQN